MSQQWREIFENDIEDIQRRMNAFAEAKVQCQSKMLEIQKQAEAQLNQLATEIQNIDKEVQSLAEDLKRRQSVLGIGEEESNGFAPYSEPERPEKRASPTRLPAKKKVTSNG